MVVEENPLQNLKVLYGTGAIRVTAENKVVRVGGVKYTIKDGIVYDAKKLLADVRQIVEEAKEKEGKGIVQPGMWIPNPMLVRRTAPVAGSQGGSRSGATTAEAATPSVSPALVRTLDVLHVFWNPGAAPRRLEPLVLHTLRREAPCCRAYAPGLQARRDSGDGPHDPRELGHSCRDAKGRTSGSSG